MEAGLDMHGHRPIRYEGFTKLYRPFVTRLIAAYLRKFLGGDYPAHRQRFSIRVIAKETSGEDIVGINSVTIWLQDVRITAGPRLALTARTVSHALAHSLIEFYGRGPEQHRKLHDYDYPDRPKSANRKLIAGTLQFRAKWRPQAKLEIWKTQIIDYERLLAAP